MDQSFYQDGEGQTVPVWDSPFYRMGKDRQFLCGPVLLTGCRRADCSSLGQSFLQDGEGQTVSVSSVFFTG